MKIFSFLRSPCCFIALLLLLTLLAPANAQTVISGRLRTERFPGAGEDMPLTTVLCFASLDGTGTEARPFRTWETEPAGWFRLSGGAGNYTLLFTQPAHFLRPIVLNNFFTRPGEKIDRVIVRPRFDFASFGERVWDTKPASHYYQTFVAHGRSVTHVGFKLATDGVDGFGPKSQNLLISVHRRGPGMPDTWPQVGPAMPVLDVDCGGAKNYTWSAGWNSGEVPLTPGETYAIHLRAEAPTGTFQAYWRPDDDAATDCYRIAPDGSGGFQKRKLWLSVGSDDDGLLIPYNKRIHKQFGTFSGTARKWSQTYVAQGRSLASAVLYAAVSGAQPPLTRQRTLVRVRRGGPEGPVVGIEKIAIGNGNYTGDASWGTFGVAFAPEEVPLTPGETYALEFESIETYETLHGFVNIKGQVSDDRAVFNPYKKFAPDIYDKGTAYKNGTNTDFDLDMQIIEYAATTKDPALATEGKNLLQNGDMESAAVPAEAQALTAWKNFSIEPATAHAQIADGSEKTNRIARVLGTGGGKPIDGGFVQRVEGLDPAQTYRLAGRVRAAYAADFERQCEVGCDPTGQDTNPKAETIQWKTYPGAHGIFVPTLNDPVRPATNAVSVWLRARATVPGEKFAPFKADFDDYSLRLVRTRPGF